MNIMGKILVLLNLIGAVAVAGFIAVVFTTHTNWHKFTEGLKRELDTAGKTAGLYRKIADDSDAQLKKLRGEIETLKVSAKVNSDGLDAQLKVVKEQLAKAVLKSEEADLSALKALGEVARLKEESKGLNKVIEDRQNKILELEKTTQELRTFARVKEKEAQDDRARNETLKSALLDMRLEMAKVQAGPEKGKKLTSPPVNVRGTIEKVDDGLVQISLGSDQGLKENHILQVRRTKPRAEYLGSIQLVEVHFHKSIGRWMSPRPEGKRLQPGDQVVSSLDR
jgi:hypothetical protein